MITISLSSQDLKETRGAKYHIALPDPCVYKTERFVANMAISGAHICAGVALSRLGADVQIHRQKFWPYWGHLWWP